MPRYFFHLYDGDDVTEDLEGAELPDAEAARTEAARNARAIISQDALAGAVNMATRIEVEEEGRGRVATVRFAEAVRISD